MKKILAAAAACVLFGALSPTSVAEASPTIGPTRSEGAWLSYRGMVDDCLEAQVFLSTVSTVMAAPGGPIEASDNGEGGVTVRDTCNLTPPECDEDCEDAEPRPTVVFRAGLTPTRGPEIAGATLSSASYSETLEADGDGVAVTVVVNWTGTGELNRTTEHERSDAGVFVRTGANRSAAATFTITAGELQISSTTASAEIWQSQYHMS